ncbi:cation transporter [Campylobacter ornithocola]|uniref:Cation transporter n=1 Tax=Campylobacter ornithocola TaxID=1848766 RepID=A0A6M8N234_9BACT|nr:cation diffusion facilitator family transporter [Campylobacter ornithocola]OCX42192.1 cation transporter [Campylobacter ornithocola]QKF57604.1 divalent metal cation transporter [Campylobacter ornithocola]
MEKVLHHEPIKKHSFHQHHHDTRRIDKKILIISFSLTFFMMIIQFIYAILINSLALLSDTLHMFSDSFALILSYLAILATQKFKNEQKTFGYFRLEILVSFINSITIIISAIYISYQAIYKFFNPAYIDAKILFFIACIGFFVNLVSAFLMFKKGDLENINIKSAFLHIISDLFGSLAIIIGSIVIYYTNFYYIDTILGLLIALLLLRFAIKLAKESINILLESSPVDINDVKEKLKEFEEIKDIEDLHIIEITNKMYIAIIHIKIKQANMGNFKKLSNKISNFMLEKYNIGHCTIEPNF